MPTDISNNTPDEFFELFVNAQTFKTILHSFDELCRALRIDRQSIGYGKRTLYKVLISKLTSWKSKSLWSKIDKRGSQKEYENGNACADTKVCIVGAGPVGLRLAIECALLGARCVVVEKRDRFSRHNVLHLWPYVITDLKNLGAKVFYGKFATGQIEHISIRQLQCILLKIALLLGVEIYQNVTFLNVIEPTSPQQGWRAHFEPQTHPVTSTYEFNVLIGADGRRNSLQGFQHKEFRGKLAIGVTCNYVNHHTRAEQNFEEISGVAKIYNPQFFSELQQQTSIDLENIVYYKNDTHYFVMTAKKQSLLDKHVIRQDYPDAARLLARDNVNYTQLCNFACEAAKFATKCSPQFKFEFAESHHGTADVQMFDFTSLFHAVNASRIVERNGKQLLMALVGDSLLESFWPTGSGAGLGFLGLFDTAWTILKFSKHEHPLKVLVERESVYMLLSQSTPENTKSNHQLYTINPATRYQSLNSKTCTIEEIRHLYDSDSIPTIDVNNNHITVNQPNRTSIRRAQSFHQTSSQLPPIPNGNTEQENVLFQWCEEILVEYALEIKQNSKTFQNALAFCAIVHHYRPDLIDFKSLQVDRPISNFQILFDIMHDQLSLPLDRKLQNSLILSMKSSIEDRIRQSSIVILQLLHNHFHREHQEQQQSQRRRSSTPLLGLSAPISSGVKKAPEETRNSNPNPSEINTSTNNNSTVKVSALVAHYSSSEPPSSSSSSSASSSAATNSHFLGLSSERPPTFCFYCKDKVSIQDWFVVEKNVLHVKCFKCETCHLQLRKTNYQVYIEPQTGKTSFHCRYHNLNKQQTQHKNDEHNNSSYLDQRRQASLFDETDLIKKRPVSPTRLLANSKADERVSFTLEKDVPDDEKDEIVYSSRSEIKSDDDDADDDDEQTSSGTNENSSNSSLEETTDEDGDDNESDDDEEENNEDEDSVLKLDTSKSASASDISKGLNEKKFFAEQKQYLSIDSGHIQSESPSPTDLSPPSTSPQVLTSIIKSDSTSYSYFRAPCPICGGSTYDEASTVEISKQYYHRTCLRCSSCEKLLKESEYNFHDLSSEGRRHFYCTLHFCKSRLKQVTTTLATAAQQESRSSNSYTNLTQSRLNNNIQWNQNLRLYPSLTDALSEKPHPLNVVNIPEHERRRETIGFEHLNQLISNQTSTRPPVRSKTFDESLSTNALNNNENVDSKQPTIDSSKQRFKRRGQNRPSSPLPSNEYSTILTSNVPTNPSSTSASIIQRKKKRILVPQSNLNRSSSSTTSSQSIEDERAYSTDERRRQREERQKEQLRLRRSQEIQRELDELEEKRLELDKRYTIARQNLISSGNDQKKKAYWERESLCIVRERTALQRTEDELTMAKRGLTLENERAQAENEYRLLSHLSDEHKTAKEKQREEELIRQISQLVEAKNRLTTDLEQMRLRELQEDECLRQAYRLHGIDHRTTNFHPLDIVKDII